MLSLCVAHNLLGIHRESPTSTSLHDPARPKRFCGTVADTESAFSFAGVVFLRRRLLVGMNKRERQADKEKLSAYETRHEKHEESDQSTSGNTKGSRARVSASLPEQVV